MYLLVWFKQKKTADLTVVQKMNIDTLTRRVSHRRSLLKKRPGCLQSVLLNDRNEKLTGRKTWVVGKCDSDDHSLEKIGKKGHFRNLGQLHKEWTKAGASTLRATTHRHCIHNFRPLLNQSNVRCILPGLRRKLTGVLLSGPKLFFQVKVKFAFHKKSLQSVMIWVSVSSSYV